MTLRTVPPAGPDLYVERFVRAAEHIIRRNEVQQAQLHAVVGGAWSLVSEREVIDAGNAGELCDAARLVTRAACSELSVKDRGRLLAKMSRRDDDESGASPAHFRVVLSVDGAAWVLRVSASAEGCSAIIASVEGSFVEPVQAAA